jgi:uncharacterized short protein YbdD (DUF466 family)
MTALDVVRRGAKDVVWFCRGVLGADAYEKYKAHVEAEHPRDAAEWLMSEKEFWRDRTDRQDRNPQGRCC